MKKILLICMLLVTVLFACEKDDENQIEKNSELKNLTKLSEGFASGAETWVEIWAKNDYYVGYNNLVIALYDSTDKEMQITDGHVTLSPMMTMHHHKSSNAQAPMMHMHSTPVENPVMVSGDGFFPGAITFIMPTLSMGKWSLEVGVHNHNNGKHGKAMFDITVNALDDALVKSFISDQDTFFLTLVNPMEPEVGVNDMQLALYQRNGPMLYPAKENVTISMTPEMPSMGHGSPNNVDPVDMGDGHYEGQVNFTMTGWWKLNLILTEGIDTLTDKVYFDINF